MGDIIHVNERVERIEPPAKTVGVAPVPRKVLPHNDRGKRRKLKLGMTAAITGPIAAAFWLGSQPSLELFMKASITQKFYMAKDFVTHGFGRDGDKEMRDIFQAATPEDRYHSAERGIVEIRCTDKATGKYYPEIPARALSADDGRFNLRDGCHYSL